MCFKDLQALGWVISPGTSADCPWQAFDAVPVCRTVCGADVPGWGQNQHRWAVWTGRRTVPGLAQLLGARQQVPQGFAAAGLRDRLHVPPRQAWRPAPAARQARNQLLINLPHPCCIGAACWAQQAFRRQISASFHLR